MRVLIVEDEFTSRQLLLKMLSPYGDCDVAVDGREAVEAFSLAWERGRPYDLVCLDIMMPQMDGREALKAIRKKEQEKGIGGLEGVKVIMTTAVGDSKNIMGSFNDGCEAYVTKPIDKQKLLKHVTDMGLVGQETQ